MGSTKKYDKEYTEQAVKLAHDLGSPKKAAEELGIPADTLYGWIKKWRDGYLDIGPEAR
ncbi:MAG: helix-turn-helix domain-containing protein, partial [Ruminiclostridium sp.]|nr:helix-turn-helix domain-containing protein [Ruminiclostridium sp.]